MKTFLFNLKNIFCLTTCVLALFLLTSCGGGGSGSTPVTYSVIFNNADNSANSGGNPEKFDVSVGSTSSATFTIFNKSSAPITNLSASLGTLSTLGLSVNLSTSCNSLGATSGSCTGTIIFAPTKSIAETNTTVAINYQTQSGTTQSAHFYISLSNGAGVVQAYVFGTPTSSLAKNIKATPAVPDQAFVLSSSGNFTATTLADPAGKPLLHVMQAVGDTAGNQYAYANISSTEYDAFSYAAGATTVTGSALPASFAAQDLITSGNTAYLIGEDANDNVVVYKNTANTTWGDTGFPTGIQSEPIIVGSGDGSAFISVNNSGNAYFYSGSGSWQTSTVTSTSGSTVNQIAAENSNHAVAYVQDSSGNFTPYVTTSGTNWAAQSYTTKYNPSMDSTPNDIFLVYPDNSFAYQEQSFTSSDSALSSQHALSSLWFLSQMAATDDSSNKGYLFVYGFDSGGAPLYFLCSDSGCNTINVSSFAVDSIASITPVQNGFLVLGANIGNQVLYFVSTSRAVTSISLNTANTISNIFGWPDSSIADVVGFDNTNQLGYDLFDSNNPAASISYTAFPSDFMSEFFPPQEPTASSSENTAGALNGVQEAQLNLALSFEKDNTWTVPSVLDTQMNGTIDNFGWFAPTGFAASLASCSSAICDENSWAVVASGNTHKIAHFVNDAPVPLSSGKGELQTVPEMPDVTSVYSSQGQAVALQQEPGELAVSYYDNTNNTWPTATPLPGYDSSFGSALSLSSTPISMQVVSSDGEFWILYPTRNGGLSYDIAYSNAGKWGTPYEIPENADYNQAYITSAGGNAWYGILDGSNEVDVSYFDSSSKTWSRIYSASGYSINSLISSVDPSAGPLAFLFTGSTSQSQVVQVFNSKGAVQNGTLVPSGTFTSYQQDQPSFFTSNGVAWLFGTQNGNAVVYIYQNSKWSAAQTAAANITVAGGYATDGKVWAFGNDSNTVIYMDGSTGSAESIPLMRSITKIFPSGANLIAVGKDSSDNKVFATYDTTTNTWSAAQSVSGEIGLDSAIFFAA